MKELNLSRVSYSIEQLYKLTVTSRCPLVVYNRTERKDISRPEDSQPFRHRVTFQVSLPPPSPSVFT